MKKTAIIFLTIVLLMGTVLMASAAVGNQEPIVTRQIQNLSYPEDSHAIYGFEVSKPMLTYTWYIEYQGTTYNINTSTGNDPWEQYAGAYYGISPDGTSVFFNGIKQGLNGAMIYCYMEDGHYSLTTEKAIITVTEASNAMPPEIRIPASLDVVQGAVADIYCSATAPGGEQLSYLWYETSTGKLFDIVAVNRGSETSDTLRVDTSSVGTRYYVCMVTTSAGGSAYSSVVAVNVTAANTVKAPEIQTKSLPEATAGQYYSVKIQSSTAAVFEVYYNPGRENSFEQTGLTLSADGMLTGTPTKAGSYSFTVCAINDGGEDYAVYTLTVKDAPKQTTPETTAQTAPETTAQTPPDATAEAPVETAAQTAVQSETAIDVSATVEVPESKGEPEDEDKDDGKDKGGDNSGILLWLVPAVALVAAVAGGGITAVFIKKRK